MSTGDVFAVPLPSVLPPASQPPNAPYPLNSGPARTLLTRAISWPCPANAPFLGRALPTPTPVLPASAPSLSAQPPRCLLQPLDVDVGPEDAPGSSDDSGDDAGGGDGAEALL